MLSFRYPACLRCPGVISWLFILRQSILNIFNGNIRFYDTFNENKPNLILKHNKNDRIKVSLSVFMCPGVSWGILGCPGVIHKTDPRLTETSNLKTCVENFEFHRHSFEVMSHGTILLEEEPYAHVLVQKQRGLYCDRCLNRCVDFAELL